MPEDVISEATINYLASRERAPADETSVIYERYKDEEPDVHAFCFGQNISCFVSGKALVIHAPNSLWKIIVSDEDGKLYLYHRNDPRTDYRCCGTSIVPYYHQQQVHKPTIVGYLKYIVSHNIYRKQHPAERPTEWCWPYKIRKEKKYKNKENSETHFLQGRRNKKRVYQRKHGDLLLQRWEDEEVEEYLGRLK